MRCGVVLTGLIVLVALRLPRGDGFFQPPEDVVPEARLVVVYEYRCADVHGRNQNESFLDTAGAYLLGDFVGDIDDLLTALRLEPQVVGMGHSQARVNGEQ
jgi:hypothetical protein